MKIKQNKNIQIILSDDLHEDFSATGEDDDISEHFHAQREVVGIGFINRDLLLKIEKAVKLVLEFK